VVTGGGAGGERSWQVPRYTELRAIGTGGFGDVVLARHNTHGTLVAIKYLRADLLAGPGFIEIFRHEAGVLAWLDDPHVVRLYEYVESDAGVAIVMELVDGVSLREILTRQGQTTAEAALVVLQGSLLGLGAAHERGIVHRDYKPENVLVNGDGESKLTDFGIAARSGDQPIPAGTLLYAAPEQLRGAPASPASDVYAATATFYECLTGRPPFTADSVERLLYQHQFEPVPLEPVPAPLRPLVEAGMDKDPERRPADGTTLVAALQAAAADAYGPDWEERGRSHLGEAALLLAALWPLAAVPGEQGIAVEHLDLGLEHTRHVWHLRHLAHLRHIRAASAVVVAGVVAAVVAAGAVLAAASVHSRGPVPGPTSVHSITLRPSSPASPSPTPSRSPSPSASAFLTPPPTFAPPLGSAPPASASPSRTSGKPSPSSPAPSPSPSPSTSPSPSPSPTPSPSSTWPSPTYTPTVTF
jgi:serine/threonine protein kinase